MSGEYLRFPRIIPSHLLGCELHAIEFIGMWAFIPSNVWGCEVISPRFFSDAVVLPIFGGGMLNCTQDSF